VSMASPIAALAVGFIGACQGASGPERGLACRDPEREVGHPRQPLEAHPGQFPQALGQRIEQGAQDARPRELKLAPELGSERRCSSARVRKTARSARSARLMPFNRIGRAASNSISSSSHSDGADHGPQRRRCCCCRQKVAARGEVCGQSFGARDAFWCRDGN